MLAQKIGRNVIPVVEKYTELALILKYAEKVGVRPQIGMRIKLAARGSGRWQSSGGYRSKFGLTVSEILTRLEELKSRDMHDCFKLLHFHLGSQITNIRHVKGAVNEAARVYADLSSDGRRAGISRCRRRPGRRLRRLADELRIERQLHAAGIRQRRGVSRADVCDEAGVPHPTIISESGRAVVAYHSALVFGVLGVSGQGENGIPPTISATMSSSRCSTWWIRIRT